MSRIGKCVRNTSETQIEISINLDGSGKSNIHTGIGFFDHMLISFAKHGFFDLDVKVNGDLYVDCHHTIEDTGIALGMAIKEALGDKKSIKRYGNSVILPMDESLVLCALDFVKVQTIISFLRGNLQQIKLVILIQKWLRNFSAPNYLWGRNEFTY